MLAISPQESSGSNPSQDRMLHGIRYLEQHNCTYGEKRKIIQG
jgi:hypothetical protein